VRSTSLSIIAPTYASDLDVRHQVIVAGGFLADVWTGLYSPGLALEKEKVAPPPLPPPPAPIEITKPIIVTNQKTSFCFNVPLDQVKTPNDLSYVRASFPDPDFTVANGVCKKER
jgi:hypothetical protein